MNIQTLKQQAAEFAAEFVESGMIVGLGTGSTAIFATRRIAQRLHSGHLSDILAIPTSLATEAAAIELGIPLTTLANHPHINLTVDGADEVDPDFNLIKGGGGALLREKIVAQATARQVIVVDDSKLVDQLGTTWAVPVEVIPFGWQFTSGPTCNPSAQRQSMRMNGDAPYHTDQGNIILDCNFGPIPDPAALAHRYKIPRRHRRARPLHRPDPRRRSRIRHRYPPPPQSVRARPSPLQSNCRGNTISVARSPFNGFRNASTSGLSLTNNSAI